MAGEPTTAPAANTALIDKITRSLGRLESGIASSSSETFSVPRADATREPIVVTPSIKLYGGLLSRLGYQRNYFDDVHAENQKNEERRKIISENFGEEFDNIGKALSITIHTELTQFGTGNTTNIPLPAILVCEATLGDIVVKVPNLHSYVNRTLSNTIMMMLVSDRLPVSEQAATQYGLRFHVGLAHNIDLNQPPKELFDEFKLIWNKLGQSLSAQVLALVDKMTNDKDNPANQFNRYKETLRQQSNAKK